MAFQEEKAFLHLIQLEEGLLVTEALNSLAVFLVFDLASEAFLALVAFLQENLIAVEAVAYQALAASNLVVLVQEERAFLALVEFRC